MTATGRPPLILVVEDSDEDFDTAQLAVRRAGVVSELRRATTGGECLDLLRGEAPLCPVVVLMDLNTPGVDGREALESIKADPALRSFPVVVLSTSADPRDLAFCYAAGANAYHVKPVRFPDHLQLLTAMLDYWVNRVVPLASP